MRFDVKTFKQQQGDFMKTILTTLAALLFTGLAQAHTLVGDYTEFAYTQNESDQVIYGSYARSVIAATDTTYTILEDVLFSGRLPTRMENVVMKSDILTTEQIQLWLDYCSENGGMKETVAVPAGEFETCKTPLMNEMGEQDGSLWLGHVPLGIVKQERMRADGTSYTMSLRAFSYAQLQ
jgi:hypothetical protein